MVYKNSIKLLFSNFNLVWKMALYFVIVFAICAGLLFLSLNPIYRMINEAGFINELVDLYTNFLSSLNLASALESLSNVIDSMFVFFADNISKIWINVVGVGLTVFFFNSFMHCLVNMASCKSLHLYIGSLTRQGFFTSFFENLGKNIRAQFCYYFVTLPFNILFVWLFVISLRLFGISWIMNILAVFIIVLEFILMMSLKTTLFSVWIPTIVVMNYGIFKSLRTSWKMVFRKFGRVFSNAIGIVLTIMVLNLLLGMFTFMVGLIVSIPISFLLYNVFGMVNVYEGQGMRYYVDIYNVITPKKKEDSDKLKDMKYIV